MRPPEWGGCETQIGSSGSVAERATDAAKRSAARRVAEGRRARRGAVPGATAHLGHAGGGCVTRTARHEAVRNCTGDGEEVLRSRVSGSGFKLPHAAVVKSHGGERVRKRSRQRDQVWIEETNESEPSMMRRNALRRCRNRDNHPCPGQVCGEPDYCVDGIRRTGGVNSIRALVRNVRTCGFDVKGEVQVEAPRG